MSRETSSYVCRVLSIMLLLQNGIHVLAFTCGITNFSETLPAKEESFTNIAYLLNATETTSLEKVTTVFAVCQKKGLATRCEFRWRNQNMTVKNWGSGNQTSCSYEWLSLSQSMLTWNLTISQRVDRSLSLMHLYVENLTHNEKTVQTISLIRVDVLYPSRITNLTVDGQEVGSIYPIDKGQKVNVSCFYDKGNPPQPFRLLDKHGKEIAHSEGSLTYSLSALCEDDWPTVRCEGNGSEQIRSVSFVVRCPPQFVDSSVKIVTLPITLRVKAHTSAFNECYLTSTSSENSSRQEVNWTLTGNPPDLVLALHFNNVRITQANWTLTLGNEMGSTNTTISVIGTNNPSYTTTSYQLLIGLSCGAVLLAAVVTFVIIRAKTSVQQHKHGQTDGHKGSIDLQADVTTMIVNDLYETSRGVAPLYAMNCSPSIDAPPLPPPMTPPPRKCKTTAGPARSSCSRANDRRAASTTGAQNQPDILSLDVGERKMNKVRAEDRQGDACEPARDSRKNGKQTKDRRTRAAEVKNKPIATGNLGTPSTSSRKNSNGLIYGDLDFTHSRVSDVVIRSGSETEYTDINVTAIAPPPRDYNQRKTARKNKMHTSRC